MTFQLSAYPYRDYCFVWMNLHLWDFNSCFYPYGNEWEICNISTLVSFPYGTKKYGEKKFSGSVSTLAPIHIGIRRLNLPESMYTVSTHVLSILGHTHLLM